MKYIMFSKTFPAYHPRAGEPTGFRESILAGRKVHTIRKTAGNRKGGETVSLREWAGRPYASQQVEFAQCELVITPCRLSFYVSADAANATPYIRRVARQDGLGVQDFIDWFTLVPGKPWSFRGVCIWLRNVRPRGKGAE